MVTLSVGIRDYVDFDRSFRSTVEIGNRLINYKMTVSTTVLGYRLDFKNMELSLNRKTSNLCSNAEPERVRALKGLYLDDRVTIT